MQKPSESWKRIRRATLERAQRTTIDPLTPLYDLYLCACAVYLAGFLHFNFLDHGTGFNWFTACLTICVAVAAGLVPVLSGAVLTLHFTTSRLQKLLSE